MKRIRYNYDGKAVKFKAIKCLEYRALSKKLEV